MADRRRLAVIAAPLLALLAAVLAGWSVAAAQAPDPLTLTITAERSECTAATLNPVRWVISGGVEPYALIVDGTPVEAGARHTTVICPALPEGATEAPATVTATVTDAAGETVTTRAAYMIVPPLPAPETAGEIVGYTSQLAFPWYTAEPPPGADALVGFLVRWREVGSATWAYEWALAWEHEDGGIIYGTPAWVEGLRDATTYEAAIAPMRHFLEPKTPQALRWTR